VWLVIIFIVVIAPLNTLRLLYQVYSPNHNSSLEEVTNFIHQHTNPNALIESFDSELFFMLDRRYHHPPHQLYVDLSLRTLLNEDVMLEYDPLAAEPDYLVVGGSGRSKGLYEPVLQTDALRFLQKFGRYEVYERVRQ
jgi:hypothetical protein